MTQGPIFIAGRSGQLARCLADAAALRKIRATAVGRPELDLEAGDGVDRAIDTCGPSAIINAAAYTAVDKAETESRRAFAVNCSGAALLAKSAARCGVPFIHMSTDYVFDGRKPAPYREEDDPAPLNVYASSKLAGEGAVLAANPRALVLRTSWVYSCYGSNFLRTMLRLCETRDCVRVVDDQCGTPTSAADLAEAILTIADRLRSSNGVSRAGIYHLAGRGVTSWHGFAAAIFAGLARRGLRVPPLQPIATADYPSPVCRPTNSSLDSSKAERVFGVRLPRWQSSLEICLDQLAPTSKELHAC